VVRIVAKGGMGAVFEVRSRSTGVRAAAKTILNARDPGARARFRREAELLARCDRIPGIVKVHSFGDDAAGDPYMILDFIDGPSFEAVLEERQKLGPIEAARIVLDVSRALGAIHALGIVHRDVKPANILIDAQGRPWLTDFGLAAARDLERLTVTGAFVGTIAYSSPEQAAGLSCTPPSDVFSLGCVLFRALAGVPPIETTSPLGHMGRLAGPERMRDVRSVEPSVPAPLAAVVARALEKPIELRYANGEELARDLDRVLSGERVAAASPRRGARLVLGLALTALGILAAIGVTLWVRRALAESALVDAQIEAENARSVLGRGDLDGAGAALALARSRLAAAGTAATDSARAFVEAASSDVATARAERALAHGSAAAALSELDASGPLLPEGRLVRARALLRLDRRDEAAKELAACVDGLPRARRAESLEILGDALLGHDDAGAERAYAAAEEAGRRTAELRAREAGAAAACGHDAAALAIFASLVHDPGKLPADRAASSAFARIAPALYRKGLAAGDDALLETAWRLAPAPLELAGRVHERFVLAAQAEGTRWATAFLSKLKMTGEELDTLRVILARAGREKPAGFDLYAAGFAPALAVVREWAKSAAPDEIEASGRALLADWPDLPLAYYLLGASRKKAFGAAAKEGYDWVLRAIELLPAPRPDEDVEVKRLATLSGMLAFDLASRAKAGYDVDAIRRAVERGDFGDGWLWLARAYRGAHRYTESRLALDRAAQCDTTGSVRVLPVDIEYDRIYLLIDTGERAEALDRARILVGNPDGVEQGARLLAALEAWDDILSRVDPTRTRSDTALSMWGIAALRRGRVEDARRMLERIQSQLGHAGDLDRALQDYDAAHR
jgi:serine/threonine-protein kinase